MSTARPVTLPPMKCGACKGGSMNLSILGAGAWGTALAIGLAASHQVTLWTRDAKHAAEISVARSNRRYLPQAPIPGNVRIESKLSAALSRADLIIVATP